MPPFFKRVCASIVLFLATNSLGAAVVYSLNGTISTAAPDSPLQVNDTFAGTLTYSASEAALSDGILAFDEAGVVIELLLDFAGMSLDQSYDPASSFPAVYLNPQPGMDFFSPLGSVFAEGSFLQVYPDGSLLYSLNGVDEFEGYLTTIPVVPEPRTILCSIGGLFLLILTRRRV